MIGRRDLRWLAKSAAKEGKDLARRVRRGEIARSVVEAARAEYPNDIEPVIALEWLDRWGMMARVREAAQ